MSRGQKRKRDFVDDVRDMFNTPSALDQLEDLSPNSALRIKLTELLSNPSNASLDVTNRLILGTLHAGGAYSDVFDGRLLSSHVDESALRPILDDPERVHEFFLQNPTAFKIVAVKRLRFFLFIDDAGARVR
jgi:hypothetical protein